MKKYIVFILSLISASLTSSAAATDTLRFILISDIHIENDFLERGKPRHVQWKPGNHAALAKTFEFMNTDKDCSGAEFILSAGDQINTGYSREQEQLELEYRNYERLVGKLNLAKETDVSSFKFSAPPTYLCRENLPKGAKPLQFTSPELKSRLIAIQGNHDTGVPQFYRNCAFQCKGVRFICFFASYVGLPAPEGEYRSTAGISDETLDFVRSELEKASMDSSVRETVLVSHWAICKDFEKFKLPILDACPANSMNDNRNRLIALAQRYGCRLYLNGHEHNSHYATGIAGPMWDVNCGSLVEGKWALVELTPDKAVFNIYSGAKAVEDSEGNVSFTALPGKLRTMEVDLRREARESAQRRKVVVRMLESDYAALNSAADKMIAASVPFAMERLVREDDTPQMKELLAKMVWKNDELLEKIDLPSQIELIDLRPGEEMALIARAKAENWDVRVPSEWKKAVKEENRTYSYRTYHVSAQGDDDADGLTPQTAWKTLSKVNSAELGFGDRVLFRCGDVFRGCLEPMSGKPGDPITYGSYGKGDKPVIEPSFDAGSESDWEKVGDRLWKCVKKSDDELANVIFDHGRKGCAWKEDKLSQLQGRDLHFTWVKEENAVYMVSGTNPASRFSSIELAEKKHVVNEAGCHDICYEGLWLRYGGAHGIGGAGVKRITIRDCDICWIGGSTLYFDNGGRGVRYGNGIEFWSAAQDILVEGCRVWECWDAGITNQSNEDGITQKNITYRGNEIWNCEYSYEYWQQGDNAATENILFENNVCRDAGKGWGHVRRWNPNAGHLMFYDTTADTKNFVVRNNVFQGTEDCGIRLFNAWYTSLKMEGNSWIIPKNKLCRYHGRPTKDLIFKYPDHLDAAHSDDEKEIQGQTVEEPMVFGPGKKELKRFRERFGFDL